MNILKTAISVTLCLPIMACETELTPEAQLVRQIPATAQSKCQFLGPVTGTEAFGMTSAKDAESALNKVRNSVAERGGNAFVLSNMATTIESTVAQADAYRCP